jgi:hypothetical protein
MSNQIGAYNPTFMAQEALWRLENALGMGARVYMGYDEERQSYERGDVISIPKPGGFKVTQGGAGVLQSLSTQKVMIRLRHHDEVLFYLTDKELAYTGPRVITDHINPAVYQIANNIDAALTALYKDIPWSYDDVAASYDDFLGCRKVLRDVAGSLIDMGDNFMAIDSTLEASYLGFPEFKAANIVGETPQGLTLGVLGERAGVQPFVNQNLDSHTSGTVVSTGGSGLNTGVLTADCPKGASFVAVGGVEAASGTILPGDSFVIAGHTQRYVATAEVTLSGGAGGVKFSPPAATDYFINDVLSFESGGTANPGSHADSYYSNIMFNRRFAALAFAALPKHDKVSGANCSVITSAAMPGLSIRARVGYDSLRARQYIGFDVLYGVKTLDPNMAVIYRRDKE